MKLLLQKGEKVLYKSGPKGPILVLWFFSSLVISLVITVFLAFGLNILGITNRYFDFLETITNNILLYFIVVIIVFLYYVALRKTYKYYITNERIIFEGGILMKRIRSIPYHKVTNVSISQHIFERILGIAKTNIHTAGTGIQKPEIQFIGLSNPEKPQSMIVDKLRVFKSTRRASVYNE